MIKYKKNNYKLRKIDFKSISISVDFINSKSYLYIDGILAGDYTYEIDKESKDLYISDLSIYSDYREKGYGSYLARHIIIFAKFLHMKSISLTDGATLDGFWQYIGFREKKRMKRGTVRLCL